MPGGICTRKEPADVLSDTEVLSSTYTEEKDITESDNRFPWDIDYEILDNETHYNRKQIQGMCYIDDDTRDDYGDPWNQQYFVILKTFIYI
ncbi:hypothetical protein X777_16605 [Ooceraea biroi]|uniref:Uncharacterized protein n=1 Tax=Ooceraea biroi TaxID=2015173 RepID=A0A026VU28_OOCBI|nr:hypothetical protein X777_16605 [Ooceraea biroi]